MKKNAGKRKNSITRKFSFNLMAVLIPALVIMITAACVIASESISELNQKLLDVQTNYALSIVDDFFSSKLASVSMYKKDRTLGKYFNAVSSPEDIDRYEGTPDVIHEIGSVLERTENNDVLQVWVADDRTDYYILSTGEKGDCGINDLQWYHLAKASQDPITGISVVSIVTPRFFRKWFRYTGLYGIRCVHGQPCCAFIRHQGRRKWFYGTYLQKQ